MNDPETQSVEVSQHLKEEAVTPAKQQPKPSPPALKIIETKQPGPHVDVPAIILEPLLDSSEHTRALFLDFVNTRAYTEGEPLETALPNYHIFLRCYIRLYHTFNMLDHVYMRPVAFKMVKHVLHLLIPEVLDPSHTISEESWRYVCVTVVDLADAFPNEFEEVLQDPYKIDEDKGDALSLLRMVFQRIGHGWPMLQRFDVWNQLHLRYSDEMQKVMSFYIDQNGKQGSALVHMNM